jgi:CRP/FNR family transcriptional regulator
MRPLPFTVACSRCNLREVCMPDAVPAEFDRLDTLVTARRVVRCGARLFRSGDPFRSLYAVRSGSFKTCVAATRGREQVCGFPIAGEIIGLDGIAQGRHTCDAIALEHSEVCVMPYDHLADVALEVKALQHHVSRVMSREIVREHGVMRLLGSMRAEQRVAAFLLNLAERLHACGFPRDTLELRMTREEIGSYLGLTLETVSRAFSRFAGEGWIDVERRQVAIRDETALRKLAAA